MTNQQILECNGCLAVVDIVAEGLLVRENPGCISSTIENQEHGMYKYKLSYYVS